MKELSKRSDELLFHVLSQPMLLVVFPLTALINDQINYCERLGLKCCSEQRTSKIVASARLLGILGLSSKLYPGNMQRLLNKDLTRFMQSLSRERQNRASKRKALLAGWALFGFLQKTEISIKYKYTKEKIVKVTIHIFEMQFYYSI